LALRMQGKRISELISDLEEIKMKYGNIPVCKYDGIEDAGYPMPTKWTPQVYTVTENFWVGNYVTDADVPYLADGAKGAKVNVVYL
jgi:hypothetical protein